MPSGRDAMRWLHLLKREWRSLSGVSPAFIASTFAQRFFGRKAFGATIGQSTEVAMLSNETSIPVLSV